MPKKLTAPINYGSPILISSSVCQPRPRHFYVDENKVAIAILRKFEKKSMLFVFQPQPLAIKSTSSGFPSHKSSSTPGDGEKNENPTGQTQVEIEKHVLTDEEKLQLEADRELERARENQAFFLRKHVECFRITNNSLFPVDASFDLHSKLPVEPDAEGNMPESDYPEDYASPFLFEPQSLHLGCNETKDLRVWCFPTNEGVHKDKIVCSVVDNPEKIYFPVQCIGTLPKLKITTKNMAEQNLEEGATTPEPKLEFDRLMMKQQDTRDLTKNYSNPTQT